MPFNPDGTYVDPNTAPGTPGTPGGTGDNGETWDPIMKRWVPKGSPGSPAASAPVGANGWSNTSNRNYGDNGYGANGGNSDTQQGGGAGSTGKAASPGAYGGYNGHYVDDGKGGIKFDPTYNGRQESVDRLEGLAGAAAAQQAYQNDYGQADRFAGLGQDSRGYEQDSLELARQTARGENLQSMRLGQGMLAQGLQAQQAGAASTRGGSLAQAAAMRQQQAGAGAFMAQGNTQLEAQRAAEMAQGRDLYQQQAGQIRSGDANAQGLNQQQAIQQMQNELQQRSLNQRGQMGYDELGQDVNIIAANAALGQHEQHVGIEDKSSQRHQRKLDQGQQLVGEASAVGGSTLGGLSGTSSGGGGGGGGPDPYSKAVSNSDERSKTNIRGLGYVASLRGGR